MPSRKITPQALVDHLRVSDPQVSPAGDRVAFVVAPLARKEKNSTSEIWMVNFDGSEEHRFTTGVGEDRAPRFSPDGNRLAFLSDRKERGKVQLYLLDTRGGEAIPLTHGKSSPGPAGWSPDGRMIAFTMPDEPSEQNEKDEKDRRDAAIEDENLKLSRLYVLDVDSNDPPRRLSPEGPNHVSGFCWSPDSRRLAVVFTATNRVDEGWRLNRFVTIDLEGNQSEVFRNDSAIDQPAWSPDGSTIAYLASEGRVTACDQLHVVSVATGKTKLVSKGYNGLLRSLRWLPSSKQVVAVGIEDRYGAANRITILSGKFTPALAPGDTGVGHLTGEFSMDDSGQKIALCRGTGTMSVEVFGGRVGASLQRLSFRTEGLDGLRFRPHVPITWKSVGGLGINGLYVLPDEGRFARPFPLVLTVHGGPAACFTDRLMANWHDWTQLLAANGYAVLMPNPRGSVGRGSTFTDGNIGDLGGKELTDDLKGVDELIKLGLVDAKRLAVAGWSHGGYIAAWAVTQTHRFRAAIMGAGLSNMVSDQGTNDVPSFNLDYFYESLADLYNDPRILWERSPLRHISNVKTPTLILHGQRDERVILSQGREFYSALKALDVPTRMVTYPREPHGLREREHQIDVQQQILDWLERYL